jgi:hypothetical protein
MVSNIRRFSYPKILSVVAICLAAITYNNWSLGAWLNPTLFKDNGSVSEFSVHSQPHFLIFRLLDITSGLLLIAGAGLFAKWFRLSRAGQAVLALTAILGVANIVDALTTLPCSETLSRQCLVPVTISLSHYQVPAHGYSSTVIALCYLLLPLAGLAYGLKRKLWFISALSFLVVADAVTSFVLALANYIHDRSLTVRTSGAGQEVEMMILGIWLIGFYIYLLRYKVATEGIETNLDL